MMSQQGHGIQHLDSEPPNEGRREAVEAVGFNELVEVDAQKLCDDAEMTSEVEVVCHHDNIVPFVRILPATSSQSTSKWQ